MEQNQLENFLSLLLAMESSLPIELITASSQVFDATSTREVATETELLAALEDPTLFEITLISDIVLLNQIVVNRCEPITLNLNHYKIASLAAGSAIEVHAGSLLITGHGSIVANGPHAAGIRLHGAMTADNANYTNLSVDSEVTLYAPETYGIQVVAGGNAAYGITVDFTGKIIAHNGIGIQSAVAGTGKNVAKIIIDQSAEIEADRETGVALGALGMGAWEIRRGLFTAATTLEHHAGEIVIHGGEFQSQQLDQVSDFLAPGHHLDVDHQTGIATVIAPQRELIVDPVEQFKHEQAKLEALLARAKDYVELICSGEGLGEWQDAASKAATNVKRSITVAKKLLGAKNVVLEQLIKARQRLQNSMQGIEKVEDDLRTEIFSVLAMAQELAPQEYSEYSYNLLAEAMQTAETILADSRATLDQLYSILCDLNLNLDLLEEPEENTITNIELPVINDEQSMVDVEQPSEDEFSTWAALGSAVVLASIDDLTTALATDEMTTEIAQPVIEPIMAATEIAGPEVVEPEPEIIESEPEPEIDTAASAALLEAQNSLRAMLDAVRDLKLGDYQTEFVEQFGELQVAIVKAQAILDKPEVTLPEILDTMDEVKFATTGLNLEAVTPPDWSALRELVAKIAPLEASDYTTESYQRMLAALERAKVLLAEPNATQADIDDLTFDLNLTLVGLERNVQAPVSTQFVEPNAATTPLAIQTPNLFTSIATGVASGLTAYRKSRIITKRRKLLRKAESLSKLV